MPIEQLRGQTDAPKALPSNGESPVEAMELVRKPDVDPKEGELAAEEAVQEPENAPTPDAVPTLAAAESTQEVQPEAQPPVQAVEPSSTENTEEAQTHDA